MLDSPQVMLFFYMITLLLIFVIQFSVACACLGVDEDKELQLAEAVSSGSFLNPMPCQGLYKASEFAHFTLKLASKTCYAIRAGVTPTTRPSWRPSSSSGAVGSTTILRASIVKPSTGAVRT